ncbi:MAG: hypothetical protein J0L52_01845 [Caulobacterales bacterium]|nr:hypothetical protein [Caulobacterales bacterium]
MFTTFWLVRDRFPAEWGGQVGLFVLIVAVALPLTWVTTRVRLASAS